MSAQAGTHACYGCGDEIDDAPGNYYCAACIAEQATRAVAEREAFDAYHAFADSVAAPRPCPACESEQATVLGLLGSRAWLRCRACGWDYPGEE